MCIYVCIYIYAHIHTCTWMLTGKCGNEKSILGSYFSKMHPGLSRMNRVWKQENQETLV